MDIAAQVRPTATLEADLRDSAASPEELNLASTLVDSPQVVRKGTKA